MQPFSTHWKRSQEVEKGCIGDKWVKRIKVSIRPWNHQKAFGENPLENLSLERVLF